MTRLNHLRNALLLSAGLFLCGAAASHNVVLARTKARTPHAAAQSKCKSTTDEEIVAAVNEKIKADTRFDDQHRHINVSSTKRVVTLRGWVKGRAQANDLIKYARTTGCVRRVVSKDLRTFRSNTGCMSGQKQCGDICIDRNQTCTLLP